MRVKKYFLLLCAACLTQTQQLHAQTAYSWNNLPVIQQPVFKKDTFSIVGYGARADGITLNTKSINDAIADCSKKGGGVVLVPPGLWLTGPLVLQSNVNLHISRAAVLQFTDDFNQYPLVEGNYEGKPSMRNQSPISGTNLQNIAITGTGIVDGAGDAWRMVTRDRLTASQWEKKVASGGLVGEDGRTWYPSEKTKKGKMMKDPGAIVPGKTAKDYEEVKDFLRPNLLVLTRCKKVLLEGVTFQNSPAWCLHPLLCEDLTLRNVYAKNPEYAQNGDGVDIESCRNILVEGCTFDVGDDGICIKSGRDEEGRKRGKPTENAVIRNNIVYHAHGGFVIGSEMSGGVRNMFVSDCSFLGTDIGLRFKTARGRGGLVEKIYIKDIYMENIVHDAILFDMYYFMKAPAAGSGEEAVPPVTEATPQFRDFYISHIVCNGAERGLFIRGLPEMQVSRIFLDNLVLQADKGMECIAASDIHLNNVQLLARQTAPLVSIENSNRITLNNLRYNKAELLFSISGSKSSDIKLTGTDVSGAASKAVFRNGATATALSAE
jgi:polygalacturonase